VTNLRKRHPHPNPLPSRERERKKESREREGGLTRLCEMALLEKVGRHSSCIKNITPPRWVG